jgi:hypothetical protein
MAAYNWVTFNAACPVCHAQTDIVAQVHVAASYSGDDVRFHDVTYRIGNKLRWWDREHPDFSAWTERGVTTNDNTIRECCYATCANRNDELYVIIEVTDLVIDNIVETGPEDSWPNGYTR